MKVEIITFKMAGGREFLFGIEYARGLSNWLTIGLVFIKIRFNWR